MKKETTPSEALLKMAALCARSEQCEGDIRQKLYRMGLTPPQVSETVAKLKQQRFVDNARFAGSFARDKCRFASWGRNKIRLALMAKRIEGADIDAALDSIDPADYTAALARVVAAKARSLDLDGPGGYADSLKLFRHAVSRGFEPALASAAIKDFKKKKDL